MPMVPDNVNRPSRIQSTLQVCSMPSLVNLHPSNQHSNHHEATPDRHNPATAPSTIQSMLQLRPRLNPPRPPQAADCHPGASPNQLREVEHPAGGLSCPSSKPDTNGRPHAHWVLDPPHSAQGPLRRGMEAEDLASHGSPMVPKSL